MIVASWRSRPTSRRRARSSLTSSTRTPTQCWQSHPVARSPTLRPTSTRVLLPRASLRAESAREPASVCSRRTASSGSSDGWRRPGSAQSVCRSTPTSSRVSSIVSCFTPTSTRCCLSSRISATTTSSVWNSRSQGLQTAEERPLADHRTRTYVRSGCGEMCTDPGPDQWTTWSQPATMSTTRSFVQSRRKSLLPMRWSSSTHPGARAIRRAPSTHMDRSSATHTISGSSATSVRVMPSTRRCRCSGSAA